MRAVSILVALFFPVGTVAGLFTFIALGTDPARGAFDAGRQD